MLFGETALDGWYAGLVSTCRRVPISDSMAEVYARTLLIGGESPSVILASVPEDVRERVRRILVELTLNVVRVS